MLEITFQSWIWQADRCVSGGRVEARRADAAPQGAGLPFLREDGVCLLWFLSKAILEPQR